VIADLEG